MGAFVDVYLPSAIPGYPCLVTPKTSTTIVETSSGDEGRNKNWQHPLRKFKLPAGPARGWSVVQDLMKMWLITAGPYAAFAWRDPLDFASVDLLTPNEPQPDVQARITGLDQVLGTGDGLTRTFQLAKGYTYSGQTYTRPIGLPVLSTLILFDAGSPAGAHSVSRPGGLVTFDAAPAAGHALTWGGLFDIPVRFDSDDGMDQALQAFQAGGFAEINLDEQRIC